jgi:hypothetical protein
LGNKNPTKEREKKKKVPKGNFGSKREQEKEKEKEKDQKKEHRTSHRCT